MTSRADLIYILDNVNAGGAVDGGASKQQQEKQTRDLFLTFHCFCTRKEVRMLFNQVWFYVSWYCTKACFTIQIQCYDVILEDTNIAKALTEYASYAAIEFLVLGASSKHDFIRY